MKDKSVIIKNDTDYQIDEAIFDKVFELISENENKSTNKKIVNLLFTKDEDMKKYNGQYRKVDDTTDVLSFEDNLEFSPVLGDVIINVQQAERQKEDRLQDELIYLFIHAVLHLFGYDHLNKKDKEIMENKEKYYFKMIKE